MFQQRIYVKRHKRCVYNHNNKHQQTNQTCKIAQVPEGRVYDSYTVCSTALNLRVPKDKSLSEHPSLCLSSRMDGLL